MAELRVGDVLGRTYDNNTYPPGHPQHDLDEVGYDGFCGGEFGRDSYDLKRVEVIGSDFVVVRTKSGKPDFFAGDPADLVEYVVPQSAWSEW